MMQTDDLTHDHGVLDAGAVTDRRRTVIVSDTHLAGGPDDPREDHVWRNRPLVRFVEELAGSDDGRTGDVELIVNGDFLEFVQAAPEVYDAAGTEHWTSEDESGLKLAAILAGHAEVFAALDEFQEKGNAVTIMAGNHDVDLYWPSVRRRLRDAAGPLRFELGREWYGRYGGRLQIAHGHQIDPANRFESWDDPVRIEAGKARLETCDGTRFVVGFVNSMDESYPFVDNVKPFSRMARVLLLEDLRGGFWAVGLLGRFLARERSAILHAGGDGPEDPLDVLAQALAADDDFADAVLAVYRRVIDERADRDEMRRELRSPARVEGFAGKVLDRGLLGELPAPPKGSTLGGASPGAGGGRPGATLGLIRERATDVVKDLRAAAARRHRDHGAEIVVCGHTHIPENIRREDRYVYFNTGSWTRYLRPGDEERLSLERLRDGESFPYELYYADVRRSGSGELEAEMRLFEKA